MLVCSWLLLVVGLLIGPQDHPDASAEELARFEGVWRFAAVEVEGKKQPEAPFSTNRIIIQGDWLIRRRSRLADHTGAIQG